jgi:hypothetical protein
MCTFPIFETEIEEVAVYKLDTCEIVVQHVLSNATTPPCIWVGKRSNKDSDIHSVHPYADYDSVYAFRVSKGQVFFALGNPSHSKIDSFSLDLTTDFKP